MRFKRKPIKDREVISKFLWFPLEIKDEIRWLERATFEREYQYFYEGGRWEYLWWIDNEPQDYEP
jgi:hypothetical protein